MALDKLLNAAERTKQRAIDSEYTSDGEETPSLLCDEQLVSAARKSFAPALRDLMHHGLMKVCYYSSKKKKEKNKLRK